MKPGFYLPLVVFFLLIVSNVVASSLYQKVYTSFLNLLLNPVAKDIYRP